MQAIFDKFFSDFKPEAQDLGAQMAQMGIRHYCETMGLDKTEHIGSTLRKLVIEDVFPDSADAYTNNWSLKESIERCKTDPHYLRRRAEDLKLAPFIALLRFHGEHGNEIISHGIDNYPHPVLEIGTPAYRIGAAILSDFAAYCGDEIPLSFWLTYWPSAVSFIEHQNDLNGSESQVRLTKQIAQNLKDSTLHYGSVYSIITSVLEQTGGGEDSDPRRTG